MAEKLKLEPDNVVFAGPFEKSQVVHKATNISPSKITTKIKCSDTNAVQASPVFACIEPNETINITFQCRFADGNPNPKKTYMFGIVIADAPADLTKDPAKIKDAWANIKDFKTIKLICQFQKPGEAPPAAAPTPPADATPAPTAEAPAVDATPAEAPPADAPPPEAPAPAE